MTDLFLYHPDTFIKTQPSQQSKSSQEWTCTLCLRAMSFKDITAHANGRQHKLALHNTGQHLQSGPSRPSNGPTKNANNKREVMNKGVPSVTTTSASSLGLTSTMTSLIAAQWNEKMPIPPTKPIKAVKKNRKSVKQQNNLKKDGAAALEESSILSSEGGVGHFVDNLPSKSHNSFISDLSIG